MSTTAVRTAVRTTLFAAAVSYPVYQTYNHYNTNSFNLLRQAHAEQAPSDTQAALAKMPWKGFTELRLHSAEMVNHNVKKLTFILPGAETTTGLSPVTSLLTQHTPEGAWIPVFRPYTPISSPTTPGEVTFLVKRYPNGKGSGKMHDLVPGDTMKFKPLHEFDYTPNSYKSMLFIAGGSGITPIFQLTNAILSNPADKTSITLIYANNSPEDILLKHEFESLEQKYPNRFKKVFTVSKTTSDIEAGLEKGYVTKEMVGKVWPGKQNGQKVLVSGPPAMTEAVAGAKGGFGWTQGSIGGILKELGYTKEDVHKF